MSLTEGGHCQGACRPGWFFYVPNWEKTDVNVILRSMLRVSLLHQRYRACRAHVLNPAAGVSRYQGPKQRDSEGFKKKFFPHSTLPQE